MWGEVIARVDIEWPSQEGMSTLLEEAKCVLTQLSTNRGRVGFLNY
jgi:hypothetical protein